MDLPFDLSPSTCNSTLDDMASQWLGSYSFSSHPATFVCFACPLSVCRHGSCLLI